MKTRKDKGTRKRQNKFLDENFRYCSHCKQILSVIDFYKTQIAGETCILGWCKNCRKQIARKRTKEQRKNEWLHRKYGLTLEIFNSMLVVQDGKCAICGSTNPGGKLGNNFSIDHNHITGQIRGLLCQTCNQTLGLMQESSKNLRKAAEYLNYWETQNGI
jgi:hypothetical protein